jgi:cold shock CspA family protein
MKGRVIQFDTDTGKGLIEDQRGALFTFDRAQWPGDQPIQLGAAVNFRPKGSKKGPYAAQIVPTHNSLKEVTREHG